MESSFFGEGGTSQIGKGRGLSGLAERKVKNLYGVAVQGGRDSWNGLHLLGSDLCWASDGSVFGEGGGQREEVYHPSDTAAFSVRSVYASKSSESMKTNWPMRRPLFPVAVAGLVGTVVGLGWEKNPWIWLGVVGVGSVFSWWGPKKCRTPAIWLFVLGVFAI